MVKKKKKNEKEDYKRFVEVLKIQRFENTNTTTITRLPEHVCAHHWFIMLV